MAQTPTTHRAPADEKPRLSERLSMFLHRGRYVFWSVLGLAAVMLVGYFVYLEIDKSRRETSTVLAEEAMHQFDEWAASEAGEAQDALRASLTEKLDLITRKYPRQYAAGRAALMRATILTKEEKWEQASAGYLELAASSPRSYLAPLAFFNAAVCLEEAKDEEGAIAAYTKVIDGYPKSYLASHALFSRGRLREATASLEEAKADYTALADNYPSSGWTSLAKNRILALKIKGR